MVNSSVPPLIHAAGSVWEMLPPEERARLGLALTALVILLVGVVALLALSGRMMRRIARQRLPPLRDCNDAWYQKPLRPDHSPERETNRGGTNVANDG